jgi:formate-dependent phosphoribosylglycinamide formyltransferase (GAR transformylase)
MPHVAFVAPHFLENTNRYVNAFAQLDGVKLSVISEDPASALPPALAERIAGHRQVASIGDGTQLARAGKALQQALGPIDRLTGALEQLQLPMAQARQLLGIPGMHTEIATRFRDKDRMKEVLRAHGVPVAKSALVSSMEELRAFVKKVGFPIIVKPQAGLGAKATHRVEGPADLDRLGQTGLTPTHARPVQAEQFVRAREFTCETVTVHGKPAWRSGTRYFPTPLEVLEQPWVQYCVLLPREIEAPWTTFAPINEAALDALYGSDRNVVGTALTHMEWFLCDDGAMLVNEVGARPPGVHIMPLMSLTHRVDMISKWAELIAFDRFTPLERTSAAGAAFFRGQGSGDRIVSVQGLEQAIEQAGDLLVEMRTPKVGQARASGYEGEGWATVQHATTEGVKQALLGLIQNVQVRYG